MYSKDELKLLRKEFWILFAKRCEIVPQLRRRKKKWILYDTGISGIDLKFDVNREQALVMIEINSRKEERRLEIFETLEKYKRILENGFPDGLIWDFCVVRESGQEVCRIYAAMDHVDFHRQNQWPDIYNFFIENMLKLETNFLEIQEVLKEELAPGY
jgi:hypothetical protein